MPDAKSTSGPSLDTWAVIVALVAALIIHFGWLKAVPW